MPRSENPLRSELFPDIVPYASGMLQVDPRHTLYWEQSGNPEGVPVVFLHGGPGAGSAPVHRRFFDPAFYRVVIFDQRGSGRSLPLGDVTDNTTAHLIDDLEKLRRHLGIAQWLLFGGSWGSTLALAYASRHAERCIGFILRGIFLGRDSEVQWFLHGMRNIFPEAWREFAEHLPPSERSDLLAAYYRRLTDPDPVRHRAAARAWSRYEATCSTLYPSARGALEADGGGFALALARIEAHYFINRVFLAEGWPWRDINRFRHLPCTIVQGRYDAVCPPVTADELVRAWPEARYVVVPDAGHSALEPGIRAALVNATENYRLSRYSTDLFLPRFPWQE
ncbi:MAG: prolyl aminopeptidase [Alphaproteobacteria bacterium]|nr:prolyl aminopeptidase [Alphaproteobacteria bacterium]MCW5741315.1 prolyl aminopeptidase [Alphaproteobacteria bacterium]